MKTRLLFVIDNLDFGGGGRVFSQLINRLPSEKYDISVASHANREFQSFVKPDRAHLLWLDFSRRINPRLIRGLCTIMREQQIDIVHGQGARAEFYARMAKARTPGTKYVSTVAMPVEGFETGAVKRALYRVLDRMTEKHVDRFVVVSEALRRLLIEHRRVPAEKVVRIYNGIDVDRSRSGDREKRRECILREFNLEENVFLIGAVGRLVWQKGFEYLVGAFPELLRELPAPKLMIVGEGPLRRALEVRADKLGIRDHVTFTGFRKDIQDILSALDLLVLPSVLEGFPLVTLEAMAMEKPIVSTDIEGVREQIMTGHSGILVPPRSPDQLAAAIIQVARNTGLAGTLGRQARGRVERLFTMDKMVKETEEVYRSLQKNAGGRQGRIT